MADAAGPRPALHDDAESERHHDGSISSMGSAALSAGQGVTPISVGLHPIQPECQAIFTQAANDCGRRGTDDPIAPATSAANLNPREPATAPSLRGCGLSMRYFLHWPCRSTSFASPDLRSATLEIDKGSSNGEAANHHAERSVAGDGRHTKWDRLVQEDRGGSNGAGSNAVPRAGSGRTRVLGISVSVIALAGAKIRRSMRSAAEGVERMGVDGRTRRFPYRAACRTSRRGCWLAGGA